MEKYKKLCKKETAPEVPVQEQPNKVFSSTFGRTKVTIDENSIRLKVD